MRIGLVVGSLMLAAACAEPRAAPDAGAALSEAVDRTLAADSFRLRSTVIDGADTRISQIEYEAPDRVRILLRPSGETISIGGDTYFSVPGEPGRFVLVETGCDAALETAVPALGVVREATDVRRNGPTLSFRSDEVAGMTGQARLRDGRLVSLVLRYELPGVDRRVMERYTFSWSGRAVSIEPPPASAVSSTSEASGAANCSYVDTGT
jgi:hypothetical protein